MALRKLGLSGLETVMIGDTPYDAEAASEAGAAAAGVLIEGFSIDSLRGAGCFAIADEISGLLEALRDAKPSWSREEKQLTHARPKMAKK
jgi:phosphoglycolate phosphatase-like HAD superfamily hydrolase